MQRGSPNHKVVFAAVAAVLTLEILAAAVLGGMAYHLRLLVLGLIRIVEILLLVAIIIAWGGGLVSVGFTRENIAIGLRKGLLWSVGFGGLAFLFFGILYVFGYNLMHIFRSPAQGSASGVFLLLIVGGLISPVAEEFFFRGIIYGFLRRWGMLLAIFGSTTLFSMAHLGSSGVMPVQIIGGLIFAIAYEKEKNLLVPITIHILGNMAIFTLSNLLGP